MGKRFHLPKVRKCKSTGKTMFNAQRQAQIAMGRVISHTTTNMFDLHTYQCPDCKRWHFGHKSYFEKAQTNNTVSTGASA